MKGILFSFLLWALPVLGADRQVINVGQSDNDESGDPRRVMAQKANANFAELWNRSSSNAVAGGPKAVQWNKTNQFGGDPSFTFDPTMKAVQAASVSVTGSVIDPAKYGAVGDGETDCTAALESAIAEAADTGGKIQFGVGSFIVDSVEASGAAEICGVSGTYGQLATRLIHKAGATNALFRFAQAGSFRPFVHDLYFLGRKENNLRNVRTITAVSDRLHFTVSSPPPFGYTAEVFFFLLDAGSNHYLGSGVVSSVAGNDITLSSEQDWFATTTSSGGPLPVGVVCAFGEVVAGDGFTISDPTMASPAAIDIAEAGAPLRLEHVRIEDFHVSIRRAAPTVEMDKVFCSGENYASYSCPWPIGGDDIIGSMETGGGYQTELHQPDTARTLFDTQYRVCKWGAYFRGSDIYVQHFRSYQHMRELGLNFCLPITILSTHLDSSIREGVVIFGGSTVKMGSLVARGMGSQTNATYPVILNIDSNLSVGQADITSNKGIVSSCLVQSSSSNASSTFPHVLRASGLATDTNGLPVWESSYNGLSCISYLQYGNYVLSGKQLSGRYLVFKNSLAEYGMQMGGDGGEGDPFRLELFAYNPSTPPLAITDGGNVGIGYTDPVYKLHVAGDVGGNVGVFSLNRYPPLTGATYPTNNPNGAQWFYATNAAGTPCMAVVYPGGTTQFMVDNNGVFSPPVIHAGSISAQATELVTQTTNIAFTASDAGKIYSNSGALSGVTTILPPNPTPGMTFTFEVRNAVGFTIYATNSATIRVLGLISPANSYCQSITIGDAITLVALSNSEWFAVPSGYGWNVAGVPVPVALPAGLAVALASKLGLDGASKSYLYQADGGSTVLRSDATGGGNGNIVIEPDGLTQFQSLGNISGQFDGDATTGNTRLLLWDVTSGALKRVVVDGSRFLKLAP